MCVCIFPPNICIALFPSLPRNMAPTVFLIKLKISFPKSCRSLHSSFCLSRTPTLQCFLYPLKSVYWDFRQHLNLANTNNVVYVEEGHFLFLQTSLTMASGCLGKQCKMHDFVFSETKCLTTEVLGK